MKKPDWKKAEDYEFISLECIGANGVAWEFLRRNDQFRSNVQSVKSDNVTDDAGNPPVEIETDLFLHSNITKGFFDPPLAEGEAQQGWKQKCFVQGLQLRILSPKQFIIKKWSLQGQLPNPELDALNHSLPPKFEVPKVPRIIQKWEDVEELRTDGTEVPGDDEDGPTLLDVDNIVVVFSLNEHISPQWRRIQSDLVRVQKEWETSVGKFASGSPKASAWVPAIRAWDAAISDPDMPKTERACILYDVSKKRVLQKYNDHFRTARRLIEGDYRDIIRRSS